MAAKDAARDCGATEGGIYLYNVEGQWLCGTCCATYLRIARLVVAKQAADEGLWFHAETAPEAYLQEALRKLHLAVSKDRLVSNSGTQRRKNP